MSLLDFIQSLTGNKNTKTNEQNVSNSNIQSEKETKAYLSPEEIEEHSWDFLYDITEKVEHGFPKKDCENLLNLGKNLDKIGVVYSHVVKAPHNRKYRK